MTTRYAKRQSDDGTWQVVYASTGHVVALDGQPLNNLEDHEADEAIDLLYAGAVIRDPSDGHNITRFNRRDVGDADRQRPMLGRDTPKVGGRHLSI